MLVNKSRFLKFCFVGGLATVVYYATLMLLVEVFDAPVMLASSVAFALVVIENYVLHHFWTFQSSEPHALAFPRFMFMSIMGFLINWGVMYLGTHGLSINYLLVQGVAIVLVVTWNYLVSSLWVFERQAR